MLKTFSIQTLGCRVNQYESDQLATLLRSRGLTEVASGGELRVVNTCSVTVQAASKSRQTVRRVVRLPVLNRMESDCDSALSTIHHPLSNSPVRTIVTGCWATSNRQDARNLPGVDAVLGHHDNVAVELDRLLAVWMEDQGSLPLTQHASQQHTTQAKNTAPPAESDWDDGSMIEAGTPQRLSPNHTHASPGRVKQKLADQKHSDVVGMRSLPLLGERQSHHQRAFLKIQDGCDAHCTYCIIPQLRPALWSKPIDACLDEAKALVDAGHKEIVLTGIFLGAYGQETALRRRRAGETAKPLAELVEALCTQVAGLHRLRFSSLEPGDLTNDLVDRLQSHPQVVPHFHLPLQSGSDALLHRMNRQYTRNDFLRMIDRVHKAFDRPAITTDIIVGFPGETDDAFAQTLDVVDRVRFIHTHAFSFSPRPGTAAARWKDDFVHGPVVNERIEMLNERGQNHSFRFRRSFLDQIVEILVERDDEDGCEFLHGRCERYFDVHTPRLTAPRVKRVIAPGTALKVRIADVTKDRTLGEVLE